MEPLTALQPFVSRRPCCRLASVRVMVSRHVPLQSGYPSAGGWMFKVDGLEAQTVQLDPWGGQQEARGNSKGAEWYVENIRE